MDRVMSLSQNYLTVRCAHGFGNRLEPLALAVFQAFSLAKPRILRLLSQKLKFWESLL
jgi:hypothetical protein